MAKLESLFIKKETLKALGEFLKGFFVKQEAGKELIETTEVARLKAMEDGAQVNKIEEVDINGTNVPIVGKKVNITADVLAPDLVAYAKTSDVDTKLADYTKTSELAESEELTGKFLDKETAGTTYAQKTDLEELKKNLGTAEKATTTTEDMATLKDTAQEGDIYKNTDDGKYYVFVGEGVDGADANGFVDLGESVELGDFATSKSVDAALQGIKDGYVKKDGEKGLSTNDYTAEDKALVQSAIQEEAMQTYVSQELETQLADYMKKTDLPTLKVFKIKETVATTAELPQDGNEVGDVRNVTETGHNHVWIGSEWDDLGGTFDTSELEAKINEKLGSDDIQFASDDEALAAFKEGLGVTE